jgi:hypothetical protein
MVSRECFCVLFLVVYVGGRVPGLLWLPRLDHIDGLLAFYGLRFHVFCIGTIFLDKVG